MALLCAAGMALAGCTSVPPPECWTRERIAAGTQEGSMLSGLRAGIFHGQIVLPDPGSPTGVRFTGTACRTRIWRDAQGRVMAHPSFLEQPVRLTLGSESDFYAGLVDGATALVVQQYPGGVASTHAVFDASGVLVYGQCGIRGREYLPECISDRE